TERGERKERGAPPLLCSSSAGRRARERREGLLHTSSGGRGARERREGLLRTSAPPQLQRRAAQRSSERPRGAEGEPEERGAPLHSHRRAQPIDLSTDSGMSLHWLQRHTHTHTHTPTQTDDTDRTRDEDMEEEGGNRET